MDDYAKILGAKLRAIRLQQNLSLQGVEARSNGRWKAVVVGSYERADRHVTVMKLAELAEFYGVPISELLPEGASNVAADPLPKLVIDLQRLQAVPSEKVGLLERYAQAIQQLRGDYNGRVLSIRQEDLRQLALLYNESVTELTENLISWGVLGGEARKLISD